MLRDARTLAAFAECRDRPVASINSPRSMISGSPITGAGARLWPAIFGTRLGECIASRRYPLFAHAHGRSILPV